MHKHGTIPERLVIMAIVAAAEREDIEGPDDGESGFQKITFVGLKKSWHECCQEDILLHYNTTYAATSKAVKLVR